MLSSAMGTFFSKAGKRIFTVHSGLTFCLGPASFVVIEFTVLLRQHDASMTMSVQILLNAQFFISKIKN